MTDFSTVGPLDPDTGRWKGVPEPDVTEELEAAGQQALVESTVLPCEIQPLWILDEGRPQTPAEAEADIEALGIVLGAAVDETFRNAVLPPGWAKLPAPDHSMWSYLVDEVGRRRVAVFFKAAPYDYRAFMRIEDDPA